MSPWSQPKDGSQKGLPVTRSYRQQAALLVNGLLAGDYYYSAPAFGSLELNNALPTWKGLSVLAKCSDLGLLTLQPIPIRATNGNAHPSILPKLPTQPVTSDKWKFRAPACSTAVSPHFQTSL